MASGFNVAINIIPGAGIGAAQQGLGKVGTAAQQAQVRVSGLTGTFRLMENAIRALPIAFLVREVAQATMEFDRINSALRVATGSAAGGAREFQFITKESERLGLGLAEAGREYSLLAAAARGTALAGEPVRKIFTATAEAATALGLSSDQSGRALRALQQMMSKGVITAEEMRGQLSEAIPTALKDMERSLGVTGPELNKLMKSGSLLAEDVLPKLAEEWHKTLGPEAEKNAHNLNAELNRMQTNFKLLAQKAGGEMGQSIGVLNKGLKLLLDNFGHLRASFALLQEMVVRGAKRMFDAMANLVIGVAGPLEKLSAFHSKIFGNDDPLKGWTASLERMQRSTDKFLDGLADGLNDVAVEQFAEDMEGAALAVNDVAANVDAAGKATNVFADAAARARRELEGWKGIQPGQLAGLVPIKAGANEDTRALGEKWMDAILGDQEQLNDALDEYNRGLEESNGLLRDWDTEAKDFLATFGLINPEAEKLRTTFEKMKAEGLLGEKEARQIEKVIGGMEREVGSAFKGIAGNMDDAFKGIGGTIAEITAQNLRDLVSGTKTAAQAMKATAVGIFTAVGAAIGLAIAGPVGAAVGSAIGGALDLLGRNNFWAGFDFKPSGGMLGVDYTGRDYAKDLGGPWEDLVDQVNNIFRDMGLVLEGMDKDIGFIVKEGHAIVNINGVQRDFEENFQGAVDFFILEVIKSAQLSGLSAETINAIKAAADQAAGDLDAFKRDLAAIQEIEGFGKSDAGKAIEAVTKHFADLRETAERLGLSLEKVNTEEARQIQEILDRADADRKRAEEEAKREADRLAEERRQAHQAAQEARREFRQELDLLRLSTGGASDGLVDFHRRMQELDSYLEQQRAAGVRGTGEFRDLTYQSWLNEVMGPINEVLAPTDDFERVRQHYAEVRAQIEFIAAAMGVSADEWLVLVDEAERSELARVTRETEEAERALADARRDQLRALEDLTTSDWITRLRGIQEQIAAVMSSVALTVPNWVGGQTPTGVLMMDPAAAAAGRAAIAALGRDFLASLAEMGIVIPGLDESIREFNRTMDLAAADALLAAGAITQEQWQIGTDGINNFYDGVIGGLEVAVAVAEQLAETIRIMEDRAKDFASQWKQLMGGGDDPVAAVRAQFDELRRAFLFQSPADRAAFLESLGLSASGNAQQQLETLESLIGPAEAEAIAKAIGDVLAPIRDYFEDLRHGGAGLTQTQRYTNVFDDFNAAIQAGNIPKAVELARLLTGDVGTGQFGSSSEAFAGLRDFIISALGGFLSEGPPVDLLGERTAAAAERSAAGIDRMVILGEAGNRIMSDGFAHLARRIDRISGEAGTIN